MRRSEKPGVTHSAPVGPDGPFNVREVVRKRLSEGALYPPQRHLGALKGRGKSSMREGLALGG